LNRVCLEDGGATDDYVDKIGAVVISFVDEALAKEYGIGGKNS
jgi:hypothetical protein